jgi:PKD repeat protein
MHRPLQSNTFFRGILWAFCLLSLFSCEPWRLPKRECYPPRFTTQTPYTTLANGQEVTFTLGSTSGDVGDIIWNFGDTTITTKERIITHRYKRAGIFSPEVTLTNQCGNQARLTGTSVTISPSLAISTRTAEPGLGAVINTGISLTMPIQGGVESFGVWYGENEALPAGQRSTQSGVGSLSGSGQTVSVSFPESEEGKLIYFRAFVVIGGVSYPAQTVVSQRVPVVTGLVARYQFNGNGTDKTGNGNNGAPQGGAVFSGQDRITNSATTSLGSLSLNGSTSYFEVNDSQTLRDVPSLTVSVWFKLNQLPTSGQLMHLFYKGRLDNGGGEQYAAKVGNGGNLITVDAKQGGNCQNGQGWQTPVLTNAGLQSGRWYHLVSVFQNGEFGKIYLDGVERVQSSGRLTGAVDNCSGGALRFGAHIDRTENGVNYLNPFNGQIDDVRIYRKALNQTQITALKEWTKENE